jgi:hypothetical protein
VADTSEVNISSETRLKVPETSDEDAMSIVESLRAMIEELFTDMRQVQWRLAKLERQYGAASKD